MERKYDFETLLSREGQGSLKWMGMLSENPNPGKDIIPFSVADMEFKTPPEVVEGLKKYLDVAVLGYSGQTQGYLDAVRNWMKRRHDFEVKPEWIVSTGGVVPAFFTAIRKLSDPGDGVIVMSPVYYPFYDAVQCNGRKLADCPLIENHGHYTIDFEKFEHLASQKENKILLFCSPHNPVGRVWTRSELEELGRIIIKYDLILLADEIHHDIIMPGHKHTVFQTLSDELADRTVTMTAVSKTFNLAGLSLSNIIIKNPTLRQKFVDGLCETKSVPVSILGYKGTEIAYNECEGWLVEMIELMYHHQQLVHHYFKEHHPEILAPVSEGTFLQWIDFRALNKSKEELQRFLREDCQLYFDEGYIFGENGAGFERWNLACPTRYIQAGLERLSAKLK